MKIKIGDLVTTSAATHPTLAKEKGIVVNISHVRGMCKVWLFDVNRKEWFDDFSLMPLGEAE